MSTETVVPEQRLTGFHHAAIICSNYESSKNFYLDLLGLKFVSETFRAERNSWKLNAALPDGSEIELFSFPDAPPRPSYPEACGLRHLAFRVDALESLVKELAEKGIVCEPIRIDSVTGKRFTFFADPDGLPLEVYES